MSLKQINMAISNIERNGSWYDIYDQRGKRAKSLSTSIGNLEGFSSDFLIVSKMSWYDIYDEYGKRIKSLSNSIGNIVSVSGNTFVVRKSSWLDTYDMYGKKINSRAAR